MREKIKDSIEKGRYLSEMPKSAALAYTNREGGWVDHLVSENIIFSHRKNNYALGELPERLHAHDYYELTLIASKESIEYVSEGEHFVAERGMAILTKPNHFHMFRIPRPLIYDRYVIYFKNTDKLFPMKEIMGFLHADTNAYAIFSLRDEELLRVAQKIEDSLRSPERELSLSAAYLDICRLFHSLSQYSPPGEACQSAPIPNFIRQIKEYIDDNYLNVRSVYELSKDFFYSREYVSRCFKQYYNTPIYEYILDKKLLYCRSLLEAGESVELAARSSGFANMSNFVKVFKGRHGCTPSEYRIKCLQTPQNENLSKK